MSAGKHFDTKPTLLEADFVIVGSGSAGSALAYRLSEDGKYTVAVIEFASGALYSDEHEAL
jgi:choline dehydrogenase-like flavoprotein